MSTSGLSLLRVGRITGSRVSAILGISPYQTRQDVLRESVRQRCGAEREFEGNIATGYGIDHESTALAEYERYTGVLAHSAQRFVVHPVHEFLGVSPDGLIGDDGLVEIKCPYRGSYTHIGQRPDYEAQIRLQLECTQRQWGDFCVWRPHGISVSRVEHDPFWLPSVLETFTAFIDEVDRAVADPALAAPFLEPLVDQRSDEEWSVAAVEYSDAIVEQRAAERAVKDARARLLELADGRATRGSGVSVTYSKRRGRIDFKAAAEAANVADLEAWRAPPIMVPTVRAVTLDGDETT